VSVNAVGFLCCICGNVVEGNDPDSYILQVRKFGAKFPEAIWAHGPCLRRVIPVLGIEIPGPQNNL
jgi:hypothetical protein